MKNIIFKDFVLVYQEKVPNDIHIDHRTNLEKLDKKHFSEKDWERLEKRLQFLKNLESKNIFIEYVKNTLIKNRKNSQIVLRGSEFLLNFEKSINTAPLGN